AGARDLRGCRTGVEQLRSRGTENDAYPEPTDRPRWGKPGGDVANSASRVPGSPAARVRGRDLRVDLRAASGDGYIGHRRAFALRADTRRTGDRRLHPARDRRPGKRPPVGEPQPGV